MAKPPVEELTECNECGDKFDLAEQYYYDELCPECKKEKDGEDAVNPVVGTCYVCDEDVRADEEYYSSDAAPHDMRGEVLVCPEHRDHSWSPNLK